MNNTTCKGCPDRALACHDHCERYQAWRAEHNAEMAFLRQMNASARVYHADSEAEHIAVSRARAFYPEFDEFEPVRTEVLKNDDDAV